ncbi:helix-turn-helix domain-containing protein [Mucilaginibacter sp. Mucisp84]|uniref:helix-turn-helix domain-containing protein n=1 Tax=Mucilaginibacter sp. Mucisp84 TaxID=3243058 RepID=UPI0039A68A10
MNGIPERLKFYREANELILADVAYMLGISEAEYAAFEQATMEMPLKVLVKLLRIYNITMDKFIGKATLSDLPGENTEIAPIMDSDFKRAKEAPKKSKQVVKEYPKVDNGNFSESFGVNTRKSHRSVTPKQAVTMLKEHGTDITENQAEEVLDFLYRIANLAVEQVLTTAERDNRLKEEPNGYLFEDKGYTCQICRRSAEGGWYDHSGLRCGICQQAILDGIIPSNICGHEELYYSENELSREFNLNGKTLTSWIGRGIIKERTIPLKNRKGKHYRLFLLKDNEGFLPPKEVLRCLDYAVEERDGTEVQVPLRWYEAQEHPEAYLSNYGISRHLRFTGATDE